MIARNILPLGSGLLVAILACSDTHAMSYARYEDAVRDGAISRGWIPAFVPSSATNIREAHDIDTNRSWLRLTVPAGDTSVLIGASAIALSEARMLGPLPPVSIGSWLPELRNPPMNTPRASIRMRVHVVASDSLCIALEPVEHTAYIWRCTRGTA